MSTGKLLRLYQLPSAMDATLSPILESHVEVSFPCAASCVIFMSVLRQQKEERKRGMKIKLKKGMTMEAVH